MELRRPRGLTQPPGRWIATTVWSPPNRDLCAIVGGVTYEYRAVPVARDTHRDQLRQMLSIHAEFGGWELAGHRIYPDGKRHVTVRRRLRPEPLPPLAT